MSQISSFNEFDRCLILRITKFLLRSHSLPLSLVYSSLSLKVGHCLHHSTFSNKYFFYLFDLFTVVEHSFQREWQKSATEKESTKTEQILTKTKYHQAKKRSDCHKLWNEKKATKRNYSIHFMHIINRTIETCGVFRGRNERERGRWRERKRKVAVSATV